MIPMETQHDAATPPAAIAEGVRVLIKDIITRPEFNGCTAKVTGAFDPDKQRWPVSVLDKKGDVDAVRCARLCNTVQVAVEKCWFKEANLELL